MKFSASYGALSDAIKSVTHAAKEKTTMVEMNTVRLVASVERGLELSSASRSVTVFARVEADVSAEGVVNLHFQDLERATAMQRPSDVIKIELDGEQNRLVCKSGRSRATLPFMVVDRDFSIVPRETEWLKFDTAARLIALVKPAAVAANRGSSDAGKQHLVSVQLTTETDANGTIVIAQAIDGYRMARNILRAGENEAVQVLSDDKREALLPLDFVIAMDTYLPKKDAPATMFFAENGNAMVLESGPVTLGIRTVAGRFPDVAPLINKPSASKYKIENGAEFNNAIGFVGSFVKDGSTAVHLLAEGGEIRAKTFNVMAGQGEGETSVDAESDSGDAALDIRLLAKFLSDALRTAGSRAVTLRYISPRDIFAVEWLDEGIACESYIMPIAPR